MRHSATTVPLLALGLVLALVGCASESAPEAAAITDEESLREALLEAQPGAVIQIPAGTFAMTRGLVLNVDGVTLRGAGMDQTVLSFAGQVAGAEGLLVNASDFTIEDLAIEDAKGDALKINEGENIVVRRVRTEWTGGPSTDNGAYGIYPVQTVNTLIEESVAIAASDAGIYVGQSQNVIVRNNRAEYNVAGIEIENTVNADVYDNVATNNTGGVLVFNMPDLPQPGHSTRVYRNQIVGNNTENFAPEGTAVSTVPAGSGVVINSNDKVEVFDNRIADNRTANVLITSYFSAGFPSDYELAEAFDPYPETIYIHGNEFSGGGEKPDVPELEQLRVAMFGEDGRLPDVMWDGAVNPEKSEDGELLPEYAICVDQEGVAVIDVDATNGFQNPTVETEAHRCQHEPLSAVQLPAFVSGS